ncbi:unnamed protein product [Staurois parvus]|uniref:Uncharacterized protein n=1 Tax=Staurois parvus TaxID=386267 RepID=A0ABN9DSS6_9NEOB|nr:unnamed protein product [Staurois parvus]
MCRVPPRALWPCDDMCYGHWKKGRIREVRIKQHLNNAED